MSTAPAALAQREGSLPDRSGSPQPADRFVAATLQQMRDFDLANAATEPTLVELMPSPAPQVAPFLDEREAHEATSMGVTRPALPIPGLNEGAAAPALIQSFPGVVDNGQWIPPDTHGAVGPNHLAEFLNSGFTVFDRNGLVLSAQISGQAFWSALGTGAGQPAARPFDPRIKFDQYVSRWVVTADGTTSPTASWVLVAISTTGDPTGSWNLFAIQANINDGVFDHTNHWADFPGLGIDPANITITNNIFPFAGGGAVHADVWVINKAKLMAGGVLTQNVDFVRFHNPCGTGGFTFSPGHTFGATTTNYIVDQGWLDNATGLRRFLRVKAITGVGAGAVLNCAAGNDWVEIAPYNFNQLNAPQSGCTTSLDTGGTRLRNVVVRNGKLWTTHTVGSGPAVVPGVASTRPEVAWYEINPAAAGAFPGGIPNQQGRVTDGAFHYSYPSIAVNVDECVALGFSGSHGGAFGSAFYTGREPTDPPGTMQSVSTLRAGTNPYLKIFSGTRNRWGDYSATMVDPVDDRTFWTLQEFATLPFGNPTTCNPDGGRWATWWGSFECGPDVGGGTKWDQPPTGLGEDIESNIDWGDEDPNVVVADDFTSDGRPITSVRWWGSILGGPPPPPGPTDACSAAPTVGEGSFSFSTVGTTSDGPSFVCLGDTPDVWVDYVPTCTGTALIETCGSLFDTMLAVFDGCSCAPFGALVDCNDDAGFGACFGTLQSAVSIPVTAGQCLKVRIGGFAAQTGTGTLTITATCPAAADAADVSVAGNTPSSTQVKAVETIAPVAGEPLVEYGSTVIASTTAIEDAIKAARGSVTLEPQMTNRGGVQPVVFTGHVLTPAATGTAAAVPSRILYAPADLDDPVFRAAVSAECGGAVVDYFDARAATPSVALLATYDCVFTYPNSPYLDNVLMGDNLATYVDGGGQVILGGFSTFTTGNSLGGRIMTPGYSPVTSPSGTSHFTTSPYAGDGTTCIHTGVTAYDSSLRDFLVLQGSGVQDGSYLDGEIAHAHRPDFKVIYSNGIGNADDPLATGQWARLLCNACSCSAAGSGPSNVAIFQDLDPWGLPSNQDTLTANGIPFTIFGSADIGVVNLAPFDKVIVSSVQSAAFYTALGANKAWFEAYVTAGGILDLHLASGVGVEDVGGIVLPGGFVTSPNLPTDNVTIVDAAHPVLNTPNTIVDADLDLWNFSVHSTFVTLPAGATEIIEDALTGNPVAMDLNFGSGRIFATTQTVEWTGADPRYLENMILHTAASAATCLITNGDFETGTLSGWTKIDVGIFTGFVINDGAFIPGSGDGPLAPCGGAFGAVTDGGGPGTHTLYQDVTIPASATTATLKWSHRIRNHAGTFSDPNQEFRVELWNPANNAVLTSLFSTNPGDLALQNCVANSVDVSSFIGQTVRVAFTEEDNLFFFNVHLDDVCLEVDAPPPPTGEIDGWMVSFHEPLATGGAAQPPLGLYFCDTAVIDKLTTALPSCDGHPVIEYNVDLAACCLVHANVDPRSGAVPARATGFFESECFDYGLDIQAVVGHKFIDNGGGGCNEIITGNTADGPFWGWHTTNTPIGNAFGLGSALETSVTMIGSDWLYGPWNPVAPLCSSPNMAFALITDQPAVGVVDGNGNGFPDVCECNVASAPVVDSILNCAGLTVPNVTSRYLSFSAGDPGVLQAVRVTFVSLWGSFSVLNGTTAWVDLPQVMVPGPRSFLGSKLSPTPVFTDWSTFGVVHVFDNRIVASHHLLGPATYRIEVVTDGCDIGDPASYSPPLNITNARWSDVAELCFAEFRAPNGVIDIGDTLAIIASFSSAAGAPSVPRTDLLGVGPGGPSPTVEQVIDVQEILAVLDAFSGGTYAFSFP